VNKSLERKDHVLQYNRIIALVKADNEKPYAVAPCICRLEQEKKGTPTGRPLETCILFGVVARYYIDNGIGRELAEQELLDKLNECENEALIPLSTNSKKIFNLCMCDKQGCQIIRNIRKFDKPAHQFHSGYIAKKDQETCTGCGVCEHRCQMQAISLTGYLKNNKKKPVLSINIV
jgi:NAD-dependent dihydropyrimidine dehydrogenase PreA subunit